jgi:hypothetical protein
MSTHKTLPKHLVELQLTLTPGTLWSEKILPMLEGAGGVVALTGTLAEKSLGVSLGQGVRIDPNPITENVKPNLTSSPAII